MARPGSNRQATRALLACALPWLGACSLMDLGDFGIPDCEKPSQCDVLNERDGLDRDDCVIWQCRADKHGCEQRPRDRDDDQQLDARACSGMPNALDCEDDNPHQKHGGAERCDEADNDCDGLIDEGAPHRAGAGPIDDIALPTFMSYGQGDADALYLTLGTRAGARSWVLGGDETTSRDVRYSFAGGDGSDAKACQEPGGVAQVCRFDELALAAVDGEVIGAAVNTIGCAHGQVRVGLGDTSELTLQLGSKNIESNAMDWAVGVRNWTEDTPDAKCTVVDDQIGARSPRLAALGMDSSEHPTQALALWLAAAIDQDCDRDADVAALGLWPRVSAPARWLDGGHGGQGEVIGQSAGCAPPRVVAVRGSSASGYAIAYPRPDAVEVLWLPRPNAPEQSLADAVLRSSFSASAPAQVALALTPGNELGTNDRGLLVAWRGSEGDKHELGFAPLSWSAAGISPGEPKTVVRPGEITAGPVAAYAPTGFATKALDRGESTGGWLVLWVEKDGDGARLLALRIADVGGGTILGEPFVLERGDPQLPFVCSITGAGFEYGFVARELGTDRGELTVGPLECAAMP